jgi:hypothetical protein
MENIDFEPLTKKFKTKAKMSIDAYNFGDVDFVRN